jgi:hypothetical protein
MFYMMCGTDYDFSDYGDSAPTIDYVELQVPYARAGETLSRWCYQENDPYWPSTKRTVERKVRHFRIWHDLKPAAVQ